jgi:DNA-directed RNA polymerase subunit beta
MAVKVWNLRPLVIHFDNHWNTPIAEENMNNLVQKLNIDLIRFNVNKEEFDNFSVTTDLKKGFEIFIFGNEYKLTKPRYNEFESKQNETTYSAKIYIPIEIKKKNSWNNTQNPIKTKIKNIFIGILPLMTNKASFIFNGCERVIISQIIKSPGIYFRKNKLGGSHNAVLISNKGSWLHFTVADSRIKVENGVRVRDFCRPYILLSLNKDIEFDVIDLLIGVGLTHEKIYQIMKYPNFFQDSLNRTTKKNYLNITTPNLSKIFNSGNYSMGRVGRLKLNERLNLTISEDIYDFTYLDLIAIINSFLSINLKKGLIDNIDHLQNKRVRSVGELLQIQFRLGLNRLERRIKEQVILTELGSLYNYSSTIKNRSGFK